MTSKTKPLTTTEKLRTPPYLHMIKGAIAGLKERKGSTKPRILKYIFDNYGIKNSSSANRCLDQALKTNVENGEVEEIKSTGSNLLFKLNIQAINKRSVAIAKASTIKTDQVVKSGNVSDSSSIKKSKATNAKNGTARKFAIAQNASKRKKETASHSIERRSPRTLRNRLNTSQTRITISQKEKSKRRTKQPVIKKTTATNAKRGTARKCTIAKNASKRKKETVLHSIERKSSRTQSRRLNTSQTRITVSQEERSKSTTKQPGIKKTTATNAKKETTLHSIEGKSIRPQSRKPNTSQTMITISQEVKSKIATKQPVRYEEATFRNVTEVVKPSDSAGEIDMPSSSERYGLHTVKPVLSGHSK